MSALVVAHPGGAAAYGAEELKRAAHRNMLSALSISILIHFSVIGFYYAGALFGGDQPYHGPDKPGPVLVDFPFPRIPGLAPLPPVTDPAGRKSRLHDGTPVAATRPPDAIQEEFPTQGERAGRVDPGESPMTPGEVPRELDPLIEEGPPPPFRAVESDPVIVKSVAPVYPSLALKAGLEGTVFVKMWVDREGKVRQVVVVKSSNDVFSDVAVEAAKQFVFTPAYMNSGPVSVWVGMPFRFRLKDVH